MVELKVSYGFAGAALALSGFAFLVGDLADAALGAAIAALACSIAWLPKRSS